MRPLHCLLWHHEKKSKQARAGTHALTFQSGVNTKQQLLCHHALRYDKIRLPSHQNDCLPCCFLTEGQALNSSKNRTGKQSAYKLPDPSTHRPVGRFLPWCLSLQPSHTVKRSHLLRKQKAYSDFCLELVTLWKTDELATIQEQMDPWWGI